MVGKVCRLTGNVVLVLRSKLLKVGEGRSCGWRDESGMEGIAVQRAYIVLPYWEMLGIGGMYWGALGRARVRGSWVGVLERVD